MGDSEFVESLLSKADEEYEHRYQLKRREYNQDTIAKRVADIYEMKPSEVFPRVSSSERCKQGIFFVFGQLRNWVYLLENWPKGWR